MMVTYRVVSDNRHSMSWTHLFISGSLMRVALSMSFITKACSSAIHLVDVSSDDVKLVLIHDVQPCSLVK